MKRICWTLSLVAACLVSQRLLAQGEAAAGLCVLDPESKLLPEQRLNALGEGLREVVGSFSDVTLLKGPALTNRLLRLRARCTNEKPACLAAMGRVARAERILFTRIGGSVGSFSVEMQMVDVGLGQVVGVYASEAPVGDDALGPELRRAWESLHGPLARSQIKVSSNVTGAEILLDGQFIGRAPLVLTKDLEPGEHRISARAEGYREREERFVAKASEGVTMHLLLEKEETPQAAVAPPAVKLAGGKEEERPPAVTSVRRPPLAGEGGEVAPAAGTPVATMKIETPPPTGKKYEAHRTLRPPAFYEQWWFWTAVGVLVSGAVASVLWVELAGEEGIPAGKGRVTLDF